MELVHYIDRGSGKMQEEDVYVEGGIRFLYGKTAVARTLGRVFLHTLAKWPLISWIYGYVQKCSCSRKKIAPFIERYRLDVSEFQEDVSQFSSFNDFFIRHIKPEKRPIYADQRYAVMPADARYTFFENVTKDSPFTIKGKSFFLESLLRDPALAAHYVGGNMVIARLCPTDCHRFYFPCECVPTESKNINGMLFSVNPIAIKDNPWIYCANRRVLTALQTKQFGQILFLEIGATAVGSIHQTFTPYSVCQKGSEKGYFSFGGSAIVMLFQPRCIRFEKDLIQASASGYEIRCLIGQALGATGLS